MRIGELVRAWRKECGKGQREVAADIGISYATLARVESGHAADGMTIIKLVIWVFTSGATQ
jgi:transcriptional regulator with XRE-family HTH domain